MVRTPLSLASYTDSFLREVFEGHLEILFATLVLVGWVLWRLPRCSAQNKQDAWIFLGLFAVALILRCLIPWGPLSFAEAERYPHLWQDHFSSTLGYKTLGLWTGGLRSLGVESIHIVRWLGPLLGALSVALMFTLGRALKLQRSNAVIASAVLLLWPAHLRYSGSLEHAMLGICLLQGICILMLSAQEDTAWRLTLIAALLVLFVHTKPEFRLAAVPLAFLVWGEGWTWRRRICLAALCVLLLLPYLQVLGPGDQPLNEVRFQLERHARLAFTLVSVTPIWWMILGLIGLCLGPFPRLFRVAAWIFIVIYILVYSFFGGEHNPLFGLARYQLIIVPFVAVGVGGFAERLSQAVKASILWSVFGLFFIVGVIVHHSVCTRPVDLQVQFSYVMETSDYLTNKERPLRVISEIGARDPKAMWPEQQVLYPLGVATPPVRLVEHPGEQASSSRRVYPLEALLREDAPLVPQSEAGVLFLGMYRNPQVMKALTQRYLLEALHERQVEVAPALQYHNTVCPTPYGDDQGGAVQDCTMTMGWYRLKPRRRTP